MTFDSHRQRLARVHAIRGRFLHDRRGRIGFYSAQLACASPVDEVLEDKTRLDVASAGRAAAIAINRGRAALAFAVGAAILAAFVSRAGARRVRAVFRLLIVGHWFAFSFGIGLTGTRRTF